MKTQCPAWRVTPEPSHRSQSSALASDEHHDLRLTFGQVWAVILPGLTVGLLLWNPLCDSTEEWIW